ncbi:RNA-guided endonuclease TnpB family protein [Nocardia sp. NPDC051756]|uniref:RNA-guided endonuclease InsQ/TnpB family protein n=1 Tax=Nocardia sp. NPDC051756 TaxID=3154751 RepID=UPI0034159119
MSSIVPRRLGRVFRCLLLRSPLLSVVDGMLLGVVRHTSFRFCLDPTVEQQVVLSRHAGAARFAFNQCLGAVRSALTARKADPAVSVPWSGFDLINHFNRWKKTEDAGRVFTVDRAGTVVVGVTGLVWRSQVCQQVFEEAAVDCGRALAAWSDSRRGTRKGRRVGFPRFKKKATTGRSFRLRNKGSQGRRVSIRVGDNGCARSVALPGIGPVRVHDDTRRLRRMLGSGRARILFATISQRAGRWWVSLNVEAAELHPRMCHPTREVSDRGGWVGVDRGLSSFLVAATGGGREVARIVDPPKALAAGLGKQRRLARAVSRKVKGSSNRRAAVARLGRHHARVRSIRQHFLHQISTELVKTHDRLVLEDLNIAGMLRNRCLARAISDAGWAEFARMVTYKQAWRGGTVVLADRWYPSSQLCSHCGTRNSTLTLIDRVFRCECGHELDRDRNAAVNLAAWGEQHHLSQVREPEARAPVTNVRRREGTDLHASVGQPARMTRKPTPTRCTSVS